MKKQCFLFAILTAVLPGLFFAQGRLISVYHPEMLDFNNPKLIEKAYVAIVAAVMECGWEVRNNNEWAQNNGRATTLALQEQEIRKILWEIYKEGKRKAPSPEQEHTLREMAKAFEAHVLATGSLAYNNSQGRYELTLFFFNTETLVLELPPSTLNFSKTEIEDYEVVKRKVRNYLAHYRYDTGCSDQGIRLKEVRVGISHLVRLERIMPKDPYVAREIAHLRSYRNGNLTYHRQLYDALTLEEEAIVNGQIPANRAYLISLEEEIIRTLQELLRLDPPSKAIVNSFLDRHKKRLDQLQPKTIQKNQEP